MDEIPAYRTIAINGVLRITSMTEFQAEHSCSMKDIKPWDLKKFQKIVQIAKV